MISIVIKVPLSVRFLYILNEKSSLFSELIGGSVTTCLWYPKKRHFFFNDLLYKVKSYGSKVNPLVP